MRKITDHVLLKMHSENKPGKEIAEFFGVSPAAVSKRIKYLKQTRPPESLEKLAPGKRKFAIEVASGKSRSQAALCSFECSSMASAKSIGSTLMKDPDVKLAVTDLLAQVGAPRRHRIERLRDYIDHKDPNVSLKALDTSFKLENLYNDQPVNTNFSFTQMIVDSTNAYIASMRGEKVVDIEPANKTDVPNDQG